MYNMHALVASCLQVATRVLIGIDTGICQINVRKDEQH